MPLDADEARPHGRLGGGDIEPRAATSDAMSLAAAEHAAQRRELALDLRDAVICVLARPAVPPSISSNGPTTKATRQLGSGRVTASSTFFMPRPSRRRARGPRRDA